MGGQMSEVGGQMSEVRCLRSESEVGGRETGESRSNSERLE